MQNSSDVHSLQPSDRLSSAPASELKNAFKGVFQRVLETGAVSVSRHGKREAVLLSAELYDGLIADLAERDPLNTLRREYNARFAAVQSDRARAAYEDAFDSSPEELGRAAVKGSRAEA